LSRKLVEKLPQPALHEDDGDIYDEDSEALRLEVYGKLGNRSFLDIIKAIRDPEEPGTLEELQMVNEDFVEVKSTVSFCPKALKSTKRARSRTSGLPGLPRILNANVLLPLLCA